MAAVANLLGALVGTAVAETIAEGLIDTRVIAQGALFLGSALASACIWNLLTWWLGLPSSSSHGLVGGMIGAALAASSGQWHSVIWWLPQEHWWQTAGVFPKVILPMIASPVVGFLAAFVFMGGLYFFLSWCAQRTGIFRKLGRTPFVSAFFGKAQIVSAVGMGLSHGMNDAQKTMGIVALALAGANAGGTLDELPQWLGFLRLPDATGGGLHIPAWVVVLCALTMAAGTAAGGWRIIRTLGHRLVHLHPVNGFAAETGSALVIAGASIAGIPLSTTHCVSSAIMGVGAAKRFSAIRWPLVRRMAWAWIFTLPATALLGWLIFMVAGVF